MANLLLKVQNVLHECEINVYLVAGVGQMDELQLNYEALYV